MYLEESSYATTLFIVPSNRFLLALSADTGAISYLIT